MPKESLSQNMPASSRPEDWASQFVDGNHREVFRQVVSSLGETGAYFRSDWVKKSLEGGLVKVLMECNWTGVPFLKRAQGINGAIDQYTVGHIGASEDELGQPIDVFKIVKVSESDEPHVKSMTIATLNKGLRRFVEPVGFSIRFANMQHTRLDLHYRGTDIVRTQVVSGPDAIFPTSRQNPEGQYICFDFLSGTGVGTLTIEAGYEQERASRTHIRQH